MLTVVLVYVIHFRSFGWTIQMQTEWAVYVRALAVSILAAIYPMRRLLQTPVAVALKQE